MWDEPTGSLDNYIAATARRHDLTIVTGNDKDFWRPGLKVFNPFKELADLAP
jgi:predicted nuclease of predicted toxin-antitoxin system